MSGSAWPDCSDRILSRREISNEERITGAFDERVGRLKASDFSGVSADSLQHGARPPPAHEGAVAVCDVNNKGVCAQ